MNLKYITIITILFFLNIFLLFTIKNNKYDEIILGFQNMHFSDSLKIEKMGCLINSFNNSNTISNNIKNNNSLIKAILKNDKTKILVHFSEGQCSVCLEECILDLYTICDKIGKENILITGTFKNDTSFYNFTNKLDTVFTHIPTKEFNSICESSKPIIIAIDNQLNVKAIFISDLLKNEDRYDFFNKTIPSIYNKK
jgi:hypothetical protein